MNVTERKKKCLDEFEIGEDDWAARTKEEDDKEDRKRENQNRRNGKTKKE